MTERWRYCCPHCGGHTYYARNKRNNHAIINPEHTYRCEGCEDTFNQPRDKKASPNAGTPEGETA